MSSPEILKDLLERVRKAEGPDHEINLALAKWRGRCPENAFIHSMVKNGTWLKSYWANGSDHGECQPLTSSLDACLSLLREVLPECGWSVEYMNAKNLYSAHVDTPDVFQNFAPTPALAILDCILSAILSQHSIKE